MNRRTLLSGGLYGIAAIGLWRLGAGMPPLPPILSR